MSDSKSTRLKEPKKDLYEVYLRGGGGDKLEDAVPCYELDFPEDEDDDGFRIPAIDAEVVLAWRLGKADGKDIRDRATIEARVAVLNGTKRSTRKEAVMAYLAANPVPSKGSHAEWLALAVEALAPEKA